MTQDVFEIIIKIFAIIIKSDGVAPQELVAFDKFLKTQFEGQKYEHFRTLFEKFFETVIGTEEELDVYAKEALTELDQEERLMIYVRLCEIVKSDGKKTLTEQKLLKHLQSIFQLNQDYINIIETFVFTNITELCDLDNIGYIKSGYFQYENEILTFPSFSVDCEIVFSFLEDLGFFILKILKTDEDLYFNNQLISTGSSFFFYPGSTIISKNLEPIHGHFMGLVIFDGIENSGHQLHFSKLWSFLNTVKNKNKNIIECEELEYRHPNGKIGITDFEFKTRGGELIAMMGSSGSGKSTLLNILNGNYSPSKGRVMYNGADVHKENESVKPYFGYVPQDDLLIDDLTVFQNLYFSARLSIPDLSKSECARRSIEILKEVGLYEVKDLKVGNPLSKTISGGQRKRLNIALELIRNPEVLFMDEPTSGLSSRDSENIINLLRKLTFKGKLVFVVIHQPSSEIYKLFDKLILLDVGGYQIYSGDPVEAVSYFKKCINHISSNITSCPSCGNINPEIIFDIVENEEIDERGNHLDSRKTLPTTWYRRYKISPNESETKDFDDAEIIVEKPKAQKKKNIFNQFATFFKRDVIAKISNKQFIYVSLLEPLVLSIILSFVVRFFPNFGQNAGTYIFADNDNVPSFIFISIIVSIFMGLTLSAEEIFKDLKILKREEFLLLSRFSYLTSKVGIQFIISFIQTAIFILPSCYIIGNLDLFFQYFFILFACACFGNILALNISSTFSSIGTIYILIPILLIPQLILGGIIITFDKMNPTITNQDKVPVIADFMTSRWAFEAACVAQFRDNRYSKIFYQLDKEISKCDYKYVYYIPELQNRVDAIEWSMLENDAKNVLKTYQNLQLLKSELKEEVPTFNQDLLEINNFSQKSIDSLKRVLESVNKKYLSTKIALDQKRIKLERDFTHTKGVEFLPKLKGQNDNRTLETLVKKRDGDRILEIDGRLVQIIDPIYNDNIVKKNPFDYRSNFYTPVKNIFGININTFWFNLGVIWFMIIFLFITLYFNLLKKVISIRLVFTNE